MYFQVKLIGKSCPWVNDVIENISLKCMERDSTSLFCKFTHLALEMNNDILWQEFYASLI